MSRHIVGEPVKALSADHHWCWYCSRSGLELNYDGELEICTYCDGLGQVECGGDHCVICLDETLGIS